MFVSPLVLNKLTSTTRVRLAYALFIITPAMWSTNYIVARYAPGIVGPHLLAFLRWFFAFCLMMPFALPELRAKWTDWRSDWPQFLLLGALGMWICGAFVYIGAETTEALNIGLLYAMAPVFVAIASAWFFADRLRGAQVIGLVLSLVGVLIIVARGSWQALVSVKFTHGDIWILIAVLSWTTYSILLRKNESSLSAFARVAVITAGGLVVLTPFTLYEIAAHGGPGDWNQALILSIVAAVLPGFGAYQAYSFLQQEFGAARAGLVLYMSPLYTAVLAWLILSEPPSWFHAAGAAFVLPGMYLAMSGGRKQG